METISKSTRTARKEHTCDWCCGPIKTGEKYHAQALKGDEIYNWKNHISCCEIALKLDMFDNAEEGLSSEGFQDCITEEYLNIFYTEDLPAFPEQLESVLKHHKIK